MDARNTWLLRSPIAHRGLHNSAMPENSLAAFSAAIEGGYPIELDVHIIDDGEIIVFHDDILGRMTKSDGYTSRLTTRDLSNLHLGGTDETIPTFQEVLELVNGKTPLLIEIKNNNKVGELEKKTIDMLKSYNGDIAVQSFNPYSMEYFKLHAPDIMRGQLSCVFPKTELTFIKRYLLSRLKMNKVSSPDFISYYFENLPSKFVTKTHLPVLAWTIKSNTDYAQVANFCDQIIFQDFIPKV